jgi:hypothetical protein
VNITVTTSGENKGLEVEMNALLHIYSEGIFHKFFLYEYSFLPFISKRSSDCDTDSSVSCFYRA